MGLAQPLTPQDYRTRYLALKEEGQRAAGRRTECAHVNNPAQIPTERVVLREIIPPGWYWTTTVPRGQTLRIINAGGTHGVAALFWNARDTSERFNPGDTIKVQWTARISAGRLLLSDMGRVLASITEDTCGLHDCVTGCSTAETTKKKYKQTTTGASLRNSWDNFQLAAAKHGMDSRDVGPCITFFAPVVTDSDGQFAWKEDGIRPGAHLDLRAEMDLIVALSNCPHPLSPEQSWKASSVEAMVWHSPAIAANDFCRHATVENVRAFVNTDSLFGGK